MAIELDWREPLIVGRATIQRTRLLTTFYSLAFIGVIKSKGDFMSIDYYAKSVELLERIANSVHERDSKNPNLLCFTSNEVQLVELWLKEFKENRPNLWLTPK